MDSSVGPSRRLIGRAMFGVPALSCGMPSPSHHGFFSDWAAAATGNSAGASAVVAIPLIKLLREISVLPTTRSRINLGYGVGFFHKPICSVYTACKGNREHVR